MKYYDVYRHIKEHFPYLRCSMTSIYRWYKLLTNVKEIFVQHKRQPSQHLIQRQNDVKQFIGDSTLLSRSDIANYFGMSIRTVGRYLQSLNYRYRVLYKVPHKLTDENKQQRVFYAKILLAILRECEKQNFMNIITGDESYFDWEYHPKAGYFQAQCPIPQVVHSTMTKDKRLFTIFIHGGGHAIIHESNKGKMMDSIALLAVMKKPRSC